MIRSLAATCALMSLIACAPEVPDSGATDIPQRVGMAPQEAQVVVQDIIAGGGCSMSFDAIQAQLDIRGYAPGVADPTTEQGQLILANRFILESTVMTMAEDGLLSRSGSTYSSRIGVCA